MIRGWFELFVWKDNGWSSGSMYGTHLACRPWLRTHYSTHWPSSSGYLFHSPLSLFNLFLFLFVFCFLFCLLLLCLSRLFSFLFFSSFPSSISYILVTGNFNKVPMLVGTCHDEQSFEACPWYGDMTADQYPSVLTKIYPSNIAPLVEKVINNKKEIRTIKRKRRQW